MRTEEEIAREVERKVGEAFTSGARGIELNRLRVSLIVEAIKEGRVRLQDHERRVYINHLRRQHDRIRILGEMLAAERIARQQAYGWYAKRLQSRVWGMFDLMLMYSGKAGTLALALLHLNANAK